MNKKVSVIMGIYNCENTLDKAINSIVNQTYTNWELIMCDDASTDNTYVVAKEYEKKYPNKIIVLKNEVNMRLAASLNRCIEVATGEYIARMDADDECVQNRFEKQVDFLNKNVEYDVVGSARFLNDESGYMKITKVKENPNKMDLKYGTPFAHPTIMIRKECINQLNGYQVLPRTIRGQDLDLWFRFFASGYKGYNLKEPLLIYHEDLKDYKKRTLKTSLMYVKTNLYGFKLLNFSLKTYIYAFKPLISAILPNKVMMKYHRKEK